jgi:MFS family permease
MDTDAEYTEMVVEKHLEEQDGVTYKMYEPKPLSQLRLFLLTFAAFGISLAWSVLNGHTSPALQELGLSTEFTSYAWIGGPLLGAVVKLFVGIVSDRITWKIGRRRIFMVFGIVFLISAYALFGNARTIGELLQEKMAGALVAVGSFWIIYASILLIQAPYRALLADTLSPSQQKTGNAYFSFFNGIGKVILL